MKELKVKITPDDTDFQQTLKNIQSGKYTVKVNINGSSVKGVTQNINQMNNAASKSNSVFGKLKNTISNTFSSGKLAMTGYLAILR